MRFRLAFSLISAAAAICNVEPAAAQYWYWCDPARAYYPYVTTCAAPWRAVSPQPIQQQQQQTYQQQIEQQQEATRQQQLAPWLK